MIRRLVFFVAWSSIFASLSQAGLAIPEDHNELQSTFPRFDYVSKLNQGDATQQDIRQLDNEIQNEMKMIEPTFPKQEHQKLKAMPSSDSIPRFGSGKMSLSIPDINNDVSITDGTKSSNLFPPTTNLKLLKPEGKPKGLAPLKPSMPIRFAPQPPKPNLSQMNIRSTEETAFGFADQLKFKDLSGSVDGAKEANVDEMKDQFSEMELKIGNQDGPEARTIEDLVEMSEDFLNPEEMKFRNIVENVDDVKGNIEDFVQTKEDLSNIGDMKMGNIIDGFKGGHNNVMKVDGIVNGMKGGANIDNLETNRDNMGNVPDMPEKSIGNVVQARENLADDVTGILDELSDMIEDDEGKLRVESSPVQVQDESSKEGLNRRYGFGFFNAGYGLKPVPVPGHFDAGENFQDEYSPGNYPEKRRYNNDADVKK